MTNRFFFLLSCAVLLGQFGCVGKSAYQKKVEETSCLTRELTELQLRNTELARETEGILTEQSRLRARVAELEAGNRSLEQMLNAKTEPSYGMVAELEREKARLTDDLARLLSAREGKVRDVSRIYETLLEGMKDEIASGRVTVSELRGRVTIAVRDEALFNGDKDEINPTGIPLLRKIAANLKGVGENEVGIALPFVIPENVPVTAPRNGNPAVLPAARAVAIARFFRQEGIGPENLIAMARGEFAPVRDADRPTTLGKASRVEITVSAGD
jgi:chemotaxis protein MotB